MATKLKGESNEKDAYFNKALAGAAPDLLASAGLHPDPLKNIHNNNKEEEDEDFYGDEENAPSELALAMGFPSAKEYYAAKNKGPVIIKSQTQSNHRSDIDYEQKNNEEVEELSELSYDINKKIDEKQKKLDEKLDKDHDQNDAEEAELKLLREKRLKMLRQNASWSGSYSEIFEENFLSNVTETERVVCHFYHNNFERCKIIDKHLSALATGYRQTKFIKINAEKSPFFVGKLSIRTLPTLIFFKNGIAIDRMIGFNDVGNKDDFTTQQLATRLAKAEMIDAPHLLKNNNKNNNGGRIVGGQTISGRVGGITSAQAKLKARDAELSDDEDEDF